MSIYYSCDSHVVEAEDDPAAAVATIRYALVTNGVEEQLQVRVQLTTGV